MLDLESMIKHCKEVAKEQSELYECYMQHGEQGDYVNECLKCAEEHRQLAEWLKELEQLREQTKWIPVIQKYPNPKETENVIAKYYLIQNEYGDMMVASWDGKGWEQMYQHEYIEDEVIAWMPLPEPYKAEREEV